MMVFGEGRDGAPEAGWVSIKASSFFVKKFNWIRFLYVIYIYIYIF